MRELLRTNDLATIAFCQAILESEGIRCFTVDVHMSALEGSIGVFPRRILVAQRDFFMSRAILVDNDIELPPIDD